MKPVLHVQMQLRRHRGQFHWYHDGITSRLSIVAVAMRKKCTTCTITTTRTATRLLFPCTINGAAAARMPPTTTAAGTAKQFSSSPSSMSWEDLFPRHSLLNPWSTNEQDIAPLKGDLGLDKTTRHLIQLLLEQYQEYELQKQQQQQQQPQYYTHNPHEHPNLGWGLYDDEEDEKKNRIIDRATTLRCHRAIEGLISASNAIQGKAARADEILQCMQLFYNVASKSSSKPTPSPSTTTTTTNISLPSFPFSQRQKQSAATEIQAPAPEAQTSAATASGWNPTKSIMPTHHLPCPTSATYLMVLRLFAADPSACPRRAQAIVEYMQQRYESHGPLDLQPNVVHWNQVLSCWAISSHEDKAYHAANLLQQLKRTGTRMIMNHPDHPNGIANTAITTSTTTTSTTSSSTDQQQQHSSLVDVSSYGHVLRACAKSDMSPYSKKLGAEIAIKVYHELRHKRTDLIPTTYVYSYFLQALAYLTTDISTESSVQPPSLSSSSLSSVQPPPPQQQKRQPLQMKNLNPPHDHRPSPPTHPRNRREVEALAAYQDSVYMGYVNEYVLDNFRQAVSIDLFRNTIGNDKFADHPTTTQLLKRLPARARRNTKTT